MKLQQEANAHINKKRNKFKNEFNGLMRPLRVLLTDSLHNREELENALMHLVEAEMWARRSVELSGIKS
tara:strand:+ start:337 stop:543 length:207 start_codon:yes stop_codon:yes gene_type:complete